MSWRITGWWENGEYKGRHRLHEAALTMTYLTEFYAVPKKREPTYAVDLPVAAQEQPATT